MTMPLGPWAFWLVVVTYTAAFWLTGHVWVAALRRIGRWVGLA